MTVVVAGAGFSGAVVARQLAEAGLTVEVVDPRPHVGGNAHTQRSASGVMVHTYGPHIFHTALPEVWSYVQRFGTMMPYRHRVMARVGDEVYGLPINLHTINQFFRRSMSPFEAVAFVASLCSGVLDEARTLEEHGLASVGHEIYRAFFAGYTEKQWGVAPNQLPAAVLKRLPLRFDYNSEYFDHPFQGIPRDGYTAMVERMLDHPRILVRLGMALSSDDAAEYKHCFWSGPLDEYFSGAEGTLSYRTLDFEVAHLVGDVQGCPVMNYCDIDVPFTRTTEFKHFAPWEQHSSSVVYREFSRACGPDDSPYYPLRLVDDVALLDGYVAAARATRNVTFIGRLGTYRYLDMDVTIAEALAVSERFLRAELACEAPPKFSVVPTGAKTR